MEKKNERHDKLLKKNIKNGKKNKNLITIHQHRKKNLYKYPIIFCYFIIILYMQNYTFGPLTYFIF